MTTPQIFTKPSLTVHSYISPFTSLRLSSSRILFLYEWLGDGLSGLAVDLFEAFKHPSIDRHLYMTSLKRDIMEVFDDYWTQHSGDYDHPEVAYHQFVSYLPMELRMLHLEYGKLLYQAMISHGQVSLINLTLLYPDDTIIVTFKTKQP